MARYVATILTVVFVLLGPAGCAFVLYASWAEGYRVEDWGAVKGRAILIVPLLLLLWIPAALALLGTQVARLFNPSSRRLSRLLTILLAALLVPIPIISSWLGWYRTAFNHGRKQLEAEIGLDQLARDCLALLENPPDSKRLPYDDLPPTIRRLRPTDVTFGDNAVHIELHGGFDHYGYELRKDSDAAQW